VHTLNPGLDTPSDAEPRRKGQPGRVRGWRETVGLIR
jgi:hypothetical protein